MDNVFPQTGYCGIWCGSCAVGASAIQQMARSYHQLCDAHGLAHWGAEGFDYETFLHALDSIAALPGKRISVPHRDKASMRWAGGRGSWPGSGPLGGLETRTTGAPEPVIA